MSIKKNVVLLGVALSMIGSITANASAPISQSKISDTQSVTSQTSQPALRNIKAKGYVQLTNNGYRSSQYSFKVTLCNKSTVLDAIINHSPYTDKDGCPRELAYVFRLTDVTTGETLMMEDVTQKIWKLKGKRYDYSLYDQMHGKFSGDSFPVYIDKNSVKDKINRKHVYNLTLETSYKLAGLYESRPIPGKTTRIEIESYFLINDDERNAVSNIGRIGGWCFAK